MAAKSPGCKWNPARVHPKIQHATGSDPTSVTCQVTIILFIVHLFNKEIKKQVAGAKNNLTLRHAMTLAQEVEINSKSIKV